MDGKEFLRTRRDILKLGSAGLVGVAVGGGVLGKEAEAGTIPAGAPPALYAYASASSAFPGESIGFHAYFDGTARPVTIEISAARQEGSHVLQTLSGSTGSATNPQDSYATGCGWPVAASLVIPSSWKSGIYIATVSVIVDETTYTKPIGFVVKAVLPSASKVIMVVPTTTIYAYNLWGGASLYQSQVNEPYIRSWEGITFSPQVTLNRPHIGWPGNLFQFNPYTDVYGVLNFIEGVLGTEPFDYATSEDLHSDPGLLDGYNLMLSIGHDEYWSTPMRDQVEAFVEGGGNVCFFGGNTCWWQVRFERRNADGSLAAASDPRSMVCYKMEGEPLNRDPMYNVDRSLLTTHWFNVTPPRPENSMTGVSYRNGGYSTNPALLPEPYYKAEFPKHWVFEGANVVAGTPFAGTIFQLSGIETDAALFNRSNGVPVATGTDGSPLNTLILASCDLGSAAAVPGTQQPSQHGMATMALHRNNGVVFTAGLLAWHYALGGGSLADSTVQKITTNLLQRLKKRGPFKMERTLVLPSGATVHPYYFESWSTPSGPDGWYIEGNGILTKGPIAPISGNHSLDVDATLGQTWITEKYWVMGPWWCEKYTNYRVGVFVKSSVVGGVNIYLKTSSGNFAAAWNQKANEWETVVAVAQNNVEGPMFPTHVVIVVNQGVRASLSNVSVFEMPTPATWL